MSKLQLFGVGLMAGFIVILVIENFAGFLHVNKQEAKVYRHTPEGRLLNVIQGCLISITLILCGLTAVLIFG
jgi:hypothetical protein